MLFASAIEFLPLQGRTEIFRCSAPRGSIATVVESVRATYFCTEISAL